MSFTPINKLTADRALDQIGVDATEFYFRMDRSVEQITAAAASLAGMPSSWSAAASFIDAEAADDQLDPRDLVIGVSVDGEHHAYGVAYLSSHEVVNDVLGGRPIAVTW